MNKTFYPTQVIDPDGNRETLAANIYQLMTIPYSYTPGIVFEITADLYSLFITVYDISDFDGKSSTGLMRNMTMSA